MTTILKARLVWRNPYVTDGLVALWDAEASASESKSQVEVEGRILDTVGGHHLSFLHPRAITSRSFSVEPDNQTTITDLSRLMASVPSDWTVEAIGDFRHSDTGDRDTNVFSFNFASRPVWSYVGGAAEYRVGAITTPSGGFCLKSGRDGSSSNTMTSDGHMYGNGGTCPLITFEYFRDIDTGILSASNGFAATIAPIHCLRIYNRCLSAAEVRANYEIDKLRFSLS